MKDKNTSSLGKFGESILKWILVGVVMCLGLTPLFLSIRHLATQPYHELWTTLSWVWIALTLLTAIGNSSRRS